MNAKTEFTEHPPLTFPNPKWPNTTECEKNPNFALSVCSITITARTSNARCLVSSVEGEGPDQHERTCVNMDVYRSILDSLKFMVHGLFRNDNRLLAPFRVGVVEREGYLSSLE